jgi:hypothetical protein
MRASGSSATSAKIIITADGLYSNQPFIDILKDARMSFILVAKPTDHKVLFQWVDELVGLGQGGQLQLADDKGRRHVYRWVNQVPLNGSRHADPVNFFEYWLHVGPKVTYHNSWVTDQKVSKDNVVELVRAGRARWKIENETFNTLKNQGYHVEHNFGHGQRHLSNNFFILNLLAFTIHQILCAILAISIAGPSSVLEKSISSETSTIYCAMLPTPLKSEPRKTLYPHVKNRL